MDNKPKNEEMWRLLGFAWELGYSLAIPIIIFLLAGRFLDKKLGTGPWFLIVGVVVSLISSTLTVYVKATKILAETNKKDSE